MAGREITPDAVRGAAKFVFIGAVCVFTGICLLFAEPLTPYKAFLYVAGGAVCCYLAWPSDDEGSDLIDTMKK